MKKLIYRLTFQIGVNIIGLPEFITHDFRNTIVSDSGSKFFNNKNSYPLAGRWKTNNKHS